jgi:hypothetical protein
VRTMRCSCSRCPNEPGTARVRVDCDR